MDSSRSDATIAPVIQLLWRSSFTFASAGPTYPPIRLANRTAGGVSEFGRSVLGCPRNESQPEFVPVISDCRLWCRNSVAKIWNLFSRSWFMPTRTRSHRLEDQSRARLRTIFADRGWTVEDLRKDYGEDLLVRIFLNHTPTPYWFFVQIKSTDHIERYLAKKHDKISYPIRTAHLEHWSLFWEPVFLVLWNAKGECFYWECIQTAMEASSFPRISKQNTVSIAIPTANTLNEEGIRRIVARTKKRFNRFTREKRGAEHLIRLLQSELKLKIDCDPQAGILFVPKGRFVREKGGDYNVVVFGKLARELALIQSKLGLTELELGTRIFSEGAKKIDRLLKTLSREGKLVQRQKDGTIRSWNTFAEYHKDFERDQELEEAD
jgi:hypothetical protein